MVEVGLCALQIIVDATCVVLEAHTGGIYCHTKEENVRYMEIHVFSILAKKQQNKETEKQPPPPPPFPLHTRNTNIPIHTYTHKKSCTYIYIQCNQKYNHCTRVYLIGPTLYVASNK